MRWTVHKLHRPNNSRPWIAYSDYLTNAFATFTNAFATFTEAIDYITENPITEATA